MPDRTTSGTHAKYSYRVDIPQGSYHNGDTLTIDLLELGGQEPMKELVSDGGIVYAKLTKTERLNKSYPGQPSSYWAQRNDAYTSDEKMTQDILAEGSSFRYTYTFNENIEALEDTFFEQRYESKLLVPRVNSDVALTARVLVNGTEVASQPYVIAGEPIQTVEMGKELSFGSPGAVQVNEAGEITSVNAGLVLQTGTRYGEGTELTLTLNDTDLSTFAQVGDLKPFTFRGEGGFAAPAAQVNPHEVILFGKRTSPTLQVTSVSEDKITFKVLKGSFEPGIIYRLDNLANTGVDRIFTDKTYDMVADAIANNKTDISLSGGTTTIKDADDPAPRTLSEKALVNWSIRWPENFDNGSASGGMSNLRGNVLVRYIEEGTGKVILPSISAIDTKEGLLVDQFTATDPVADLSSTVADASNNTTTTTTATADGVKTYTTTVPYLIKAEDGSHYLFTGYTTDDKYYANSKTSGTISLKPANLVANYRKLEFGSVRVHFVVDGNMADELKASEATKYDGTPGERFSNMVGNDYDLSGFQAPETLTRDGKTYRLSQEIPANLTGTLTKEPIDVYWSYSLDDRVGSVVVRYVDEQGNKIADDVMDEENVAPGTDYDTTDHKRPLITTGEGVTYELMAAADGGVQGQETGKVAPDETIEVVYVYRAKQDVVVPGGDTPNPGGQEAPGDGDGTTPAPATGASRGSSRQALPKTGDATLSSVTGLAAALASVTLAIATFLRRKMS